MQSDSERLDRIQLDKQRHLINNFKLATELGAEVIKVKSNKIAQTIMDMASEKEITTICMGKPHLHIFQVLMRTAIFNQLLRNLASKEIDIVILS
ncbi:hypothetical protein D9M68_580740 [compost metagenome]